MARVRLTPRCVDRRLDAPLVRLFVATYLVLPR